MRFFATLGSVIAGILLWFKNRAEREVLVEKLILNLGFNKKGHVLVPNLHKC